MAINVVVLLYNIKRLNFLLHKKQLFITISVKTTKKNKQKVKIVNS